MSDDDFVPRMQDDPHVPPDLRSLLALGHVEGPTSEQLARLSARIPPGGGGPGPSWPLRAATTVTAGAVLALVFGGALLRPDQAPEQESLQRPPVTHEPAVAPSQNPLPASASRPPSGPPPSMDLPEPIAPPPPPVPRRRHRPAARAGAAVHVPERAAPVPSPQASDSPLRGPSGEAALLLRARRTLRDDPRAALAITDEHRVQYPDGVHLQEREVIAIDALARFDRVRARARAAQFIARWPRSAHRHHLRSLDLLDP